MASSIISGAKWIAIERFSNQFIQLAVSIVISRLVSPEEFGILAILLVFVNISYVFIDSGLGSSLIYHNDNNPNDLNTTWIFNFIISVVLYILLYFVAPVIEQFYNLQNLCLFVRVTSFVLISNALIVVPTAILKTKLDFRSLASSNLIANLISAVVGILMAYKGLGVWALISQILSRSILLAILIIIQCKWIPTIKFSLQSLKKLYKYGINLFTSSLITKFTDEGIATVIAKFLNPFDLGLYSRSSQFATFPTSCIGSIVTTVTFPALAANKDNKEKYERLFLGSLELQAFLIIPLYIWLAVEAKPLIIILLTDRWCDAIPIFQILCLGRILALMALTTEQNLSAKGRTDLCLKQQIIKLLLKIILILIALPFGIVAVTCADAIQTISQFWITNKVAAKTIRYTIKQQLKMIYPYLISSLIAGVTAYSSLLFTGNLYLEIIISTIIGLFFYLLFIGGIFKRKEPYILLKKFL